MKHGIATHLCLACISILCINVWLRAAGADSTSQYRVMLQISGSVTQSRNDHTTRVDKAEYSQSRYAATARLLWQPDHLLAVGLESGYLRVSDLLVKNDATLPSGTSLTLAAVPVLAIFSMEKYGVELSSGVGKYAYLVNMQLNGNSSSSSQWEIGWCAGAAYRLNLSRSWLIGADLRYYSIPERSVAIFTAGLRLQYQWWY